VHVHSAAYVSGLLEPKEYVRAFQILVWTLHSPNSCPPPAGITAPGIFIVEKLFSTNAEGLEFFPLSDL